MRLVFAGTPEAALPSLEALLASRHEVVAVVTRPGRAGRPRPVMAPSPVAGVRGRGGLEMLKPDRPGDPRVPATGCASWRRTAARWWRTARCCRRRALDIPPRGWVNLHFSLLPAWRGAAPVQHALIAGDEVTGATTFRLVKELDAGPTYGLLTETVRPGRHRRVDCSTGWPSTAPGCWSPPWTGSRTAAWRSGRSPAEGVSFAPKLTPTDALRRLGAHGVRDRPAGPRLHSRARRLDAARRGPAQAGRAGAARLPATPSLAARARSS